jgi:hypothetical protein
MGKAIVLISIFNIGSFMTTIRSLSIVLEAFLEKIEGDTTSMNELLLAFHERGIGMLLFFFALPMAMPVPVPPGINVLLASPLILLTAQWALGRKTIWLPEKIRNKTISSSKLKKTISTTIPLLKKIEFFIRPRLGFITQDGPSRFAGFLGFIMALTICIPLPLTNTVPSLGIALMSMGVLMRDGFAVILGALIGTCWVAILVVSVLYFGPEAFEIIKNTIKYFL